MQIKRFILGDLMTNCYVAYDGDTKDCVIIDPAVYSEKVVNFIDKNQLKVNCILLTHCHFDHIMGCNQLIEKYNTKALISEFDGKHITELNREFAEIKDINADAVLKDGDKIKFGNTTLNVIETPGHTPGGVSFYTDGVLFSGDTLFKLSVGRTDFLMGNFNHLEGSIKKLYNLPDETVVHSGHGFSTKIGAEKASNPFVRGVK